ncbi:Fibrinogen C domain-containing protein 1-A [Holothuria leucospilota]|uniref:Fibrinogen C domain-containing protein 1-A n=1 Tax=Holothuria leucospilota TaxID=206669 RepID=A0A9Q1BW20_HOLLE|nr:Fibrinogen C domain-containing protein 1-A [Holothuria leucospilota]
MNSLPHSRRIFLLLLSYYLITAVNCLEGLYFFYQQPEYPRDCKEVYAQCLSDNSSGVHTIKPDGYPKPFEVYCDNQILTGGWTVIYRRIEGSLTLKRTWEDYRNGFGFLSREFYIGNDKLSYLTNQAVYELRVDMMLSNGSHFYIRYNKFRITDEWSQYALVSVEEFSGNSSCVATSCPIEMVHESCACHTLCRDPVGRTDCYEICEETCVPKGCFVNEANAFILEGESYSDPACTKRCSCSVGQLTCDTNYRCDVNAVCENRTDGHQCYCNEGYSGNGVICRSICQENEIYGTCTCQKSCANPAVCVSCSSGRGCHCPNGFYLQGGGCVRQEHCSCFIDGLILPEGSSYSDPACTRRCSCTNGQLSCNNNYRCDVNAACERRSEYHKCYCNSGYSGNGVTCRSICSTNEVYGTCSCQKSCDNPTGCVSCPGVQRCYCPNGFYLQGGNCVPQDRCGCYIDGHILPNGNTYVNSDCSRRCTCNNDQLNCDSSYQCTSNAACRVRNGVRKCYCNAGYEGDGVTSCIRPCPTNQVYGTCTCQKSCADPTGCVSCSGGQRCYCPNGFYLQGGNCVRQERCGCYIDGHILPNGNTYVNSDCSRRCTCNNDQLSCDASYQCTSNAACRVRGGVRKCYCIPPFEGDGVTSCVRPCPTNQVYGTCTCQKSCADPTGCVSCSGGKRCYCPNGFYLQGRNCVQQERCGCYIDGHNLPNGNTYVNSDCSRRCTCNNNHLSCDSSYQCTSNAACRVRGGVRQCYCNSGFEGDGASSCRRSEYTDCKDVQNAGHSSGIYSIRPTGWIRAPFNVFCNMTIDGGGWTVFQRRMAGSQNFFLYWSDYRDGFGLPNRELWLGNDKLHSLTTQRNYQLRIDFVNRYGAPYYAKYSSFRVSNANDKYRLSVEGYSGNAGNYLSFVNGQAFTTRDVDNDAWSGGNCATYRYSPCGTYCSHNSGWWFNSCGYSLNAPYGTNCLHWYFLPGTYCKVKYTEMKIRPV